MLLRNDNSLYEYCKPKTEFNSKKEKTRQSEFFPYLLPFNFSLLLKKALAKMQVLFMTHPRIELGIAP